MENGSKFHLQACVLKETILCGIQCVHYSVYCVFCAGWAQCPPAKFAAATPTSSSMNWPPPRTANIRRVGFRGAISCTKNGIRHCLLWESSTQWREYCHYRLWERTPSDYQLDTFLREKSGCESTRALQDPRLSSEDTWNWWAAEKTLLLLSKSVEIQLKAQLWVK